MSDRRGGLTEGLANTSGVSYGTFPENAPLTIGESQQIENIRECPFNTQWEFKALTMQNGMQPGSEQLLENESRAK